GTDNVAALASGGKVYALGGEASSSLQVYDPVSNSWALGPSLPSGRFASAGAALNGKLYVLGGWNLSNAASASLASVSAFDTAGNAWAAEALMPMPTARNAAAAGVISAQIHVVGGRSPGIRSNDHLSLATHEIYNPLTNSWQTAAAMPTARGGIAAAVLNGKLYVFGGEATTASGSTVSNAVERYDPATNSWQLLDAMPYRAHGLGAVAVGNAIYVMGGFTAGSDAVGTESRALYRFEPQN
ncbi:MAG: hypothetical protein EOP39_29955, partial [Rubrivivax sp.]